MKDFTNDEKELTLFSSLANSITSTDKHFTTNIEDIYDVIENVNFKINKNDFIEKFLDMFVIDTLIGNVDRHLSNFGLITENNILKFASVYDCGSALHPLLSDIDMESGLKNKDLFKDNVYNIHSVYKYKGKRLTYKEFYNENIVDLNKAVLRIVPKIKLKEINEIIDDTPYMSEIRKTYLKKSIEYRKENILDKAFKNITK